MADFAKRPEITVETMGKVRNPTGGGVRAVSSQVRSKTAKQQQQQQQQAEDKDKEKEKEQTPAQKHHQNKNALPETKTKGDEGSARRNIVRKKTTNDGIHYDNRNKKQGGAGKGKWGNEIDGTVYLDDGKQQELDQKDPLYDEETQGSYVLTSNSDAASAAKSGSATYSHELGAPVYGPMVTLAEFKFRLTEIVMEYFDSSDAEEVVRGLDELRSQDHHGEVVKKVVSVSLDKGPRERELTSKLLTHLHPWPLNENDIERGFVSLLYSLDDLEIDIPDAKEMVGNFLARAVVDEVLPPAFLTEWNNDNPGDEVVERAVGLLSREHCNARLERIWGPGDGRPVDELKTVMDQLLKEYLLSRELDEAARCVQELKAPHFHHELVKRGVKIAMEEDGNCVDQLETSAMDAMAALVCFLVDNVIISETQVKKGVGRLYKLLPDLKLDVPAASTMLDEFVDLLRQGGLSVKNNNATN